ncbi:MAG: DUF4363 family protein [Firmicutes bacterium]|jgi:hypothetical protein|nr:DUF4363 family protein [Bacillota bacterium]
MKRWAKIVLPVMVLALFVLVMTSDTYLKRPRSYKDDVGLHIHNVRSAVLAEDWAQGQASLAELDQAWRLMLARLQFSVERDEIRKLTTSLARLRGALLAQDKSGALMELAEAEQHWQDLGR